MLQLRDDTVNDHLHTLSYQGAVQNPDNQNPATTQTRRSQTRQIIIPKLQNPVTTLFKNIAMYY
jgi:hypothetical protein